MPQIMSREFVDSAGDVQRPVHTMPKMRPALERRA
jgi:hypothetical protein